jgi:hypothetical protein
VTSDSDSFSTKITFSCEIPQGFHGEAGEAGRRQLYAASSRLGILRDQLQKPQAKGIHEFSGKTDEFILLNII